MADFAISERTKRCGSVRAPSDETDRAGQIRIVVILMGIPPPGTYQLLSQAKLSRRTPTLPLEGDASMASPVRRSRNRERPSLRVIDATPPSPLGDGEGRSHRVFSGHNLPDGGQETLDREPFSSCESGECACTIASRLRRFLILAALLVLACHRKPPSPPDAIARVGE